MSRSTAAAVLAALVGLALTLAPGAAHAAENPVKLSAKPVAEPGQFFDVTLAAGAKRTLRIELGNQGTSDIVARTYAADAYTIINGGFAARLRGEASAGTTRWLGYRPAVLQLPARRAVVRSFTLSVPPGTPPGEYLSAIVLENDQPVEGSGAVALNHVLRQAVAVSVRVPGPARPALKIGSATHKVVAAHSVLAVAVTNPGNARLTPSGPLVLRDSSGAVVSRATVSMDSFYAHTATQVEVTLARALQPGRYTVDLTLSDTQRGARATAEGLPLVVADAQAQSAAGPSSRTKLVDVFQSGAAHIPSWVFVVLGLLVPAAAGGVATAVRRRRRRRTVGRRRRHRPTAGRRRLREPGESPRMAPARRAADAPRAPVSAEARR
jgi:hypothetical protein